ncbi:MAG TPA: LLM class flavin-dependent oxidoreductase [Chloroflexota bacterium]|nr:LLM class flavin-dependent oxidoreductase [Chloroflexota bacterium]
MAAPAISFGLFTSLRGNWDDLVARWQGIEAYSFDSAWIPDHFSFGGHIYEAWTALAGLASHTSRIRIGTLVTSTAFRNPALFAKQVLTLDHLSHGRLELGLGAGYDPEGTDHAMIGLPSWEPPERVGRFREVLEVVDPLLRGETLSYAGRYYQTTEATLGVRCVQTPRPPLTIAGYGPSMLRLVARYADTFNSGDLDAKQLVEPRAVLAATRERYARLDECCLKIGRDPRTLRRSMLRFCMPPTEDPWVSVDAFTDFVGRYREIGVDEFIFSYRPGRPPPLATFERIATELIPSLRARS